MMTIKDWTAEADYNKGQIRFVKDPMTGGAIARLANSSLCLAWYPDSGGGGYVRIGRAFYPGARMSPVSNYRFDYAESAPKFYELARRFDMEGSS